MNIVAPTAHPNGTGKERLLNQLDDVFHHLDEAVLVLKKAAPNPRDYSPEMMELAVTQHSRRMAVLRSLMDEIEAECAAIEQQ